MPPTPDFRIFGFFGKCRFWEFSGGIWGLGGFAIDRKWLWAGSIFNDFDDFDNFGIVFGGLMLSPEGPRTLRECPEGLGTL